MDLPVKPVARKLVTRMTANCGVASRKTSSPHASLNVRTCEIHDEETLTGAGDQQHHRQNYNAPIVVPNDITTVNLQEN
jgi:hypothetical protein